MLKRLRPLGSVPVFPAVLALGALLLGLPWLKILLLGLLALCAAGLCALFLLPREEGSLPSGWRRNLRQLRRTVERISNRTVARRGQEILTGLRQCEGALPLMPESAREELTGYYLPAFSKYFSAYATFESCNGGNPAVLSTMAQMEQALEQIAEQFRKMCDRNDRTAAWSAHAEASLLSKKLKGGDFRYDRTDS